MKFLKVFTFIVTLITTQLSAYSFDDYTKKIDCSRTINKSFYNICYSDDMKGALYVNYQLDGTKVNELNIKKRPKFYSEKNIPNKYRTKTSDYTYTGLDRGHIYSDANADWNQKVLNKVYTMANIVPQYPNINRDIWFKGEEYERTLAYQLGTVNVVNIILYENPTNYLHRMSLMKAIHDYPKYNWNEKKQTRYLKDAKKLEKKRIVIPSGFVKVFFNNEKGFEKCFYWENIENADIDSDRLRDHVIDCEELK